MTTMQLMYIKHNSDNGQCQR